MDRVFDVGSRTHRVAPVYRRGEGFDLEIDGTVTRADLVPLGRGEYELRLDGTPERVFLVVEGDRMFVHVRGRALEVAAVDTLERVRQKIRARQGGEDLTAPMPGVVVELRVAAGDAVEAGDTLLVIESMKLQTAIRAESRGRVTELPFEVGRSFRRGDVLVRLQHEASEETDA